MRDYSLYLKDMVDAMDAIERFVEGIEFDEFLRNDMIASAVTRKFEIIGEAAKNIPETVRTKYPELPWREMSGMRDMLIHFYFGIKYDLVWHTIKDVIPAAKSGILKILADGQ